MRRTLLLVACVLAVAVSPAAAAEKVKVGFIATFSGPIGLIGQHMLDAFMLGIEHAGGKLGGLPVEVIKEDDQLKPDIGLQVAKKLIEKDRVDVVVGTIFSNVMMAIYKPIVDSRTFLVGSNAGPSPIAGAQCSPWFFSVSWQNDQPHEAMGKHVQDKGIKRVYLMAPNYQAGKDALAGFKRAFKGSLSGGEQQMLAIGRALMTNPRLLILDEATEGLAPRVRGEIWRCLETLKAAGQAILVIDKNVEALTRIADRHYVIEKGRVVWTGDSPALRAAAAVQLRYLGVARRG